LVTAGFVPESDELLHSWEAVVRPHLRDAGLQIPAVETIPANDRRQHTHHLSNLLSELQGVARSDPEAVW
jgi:ring-1,2-phenylacetyl-CoA epoxidase subunit PaaC